MSVVKNKSMGVCSTCSTSSTYKGGTSKSFIDTWSVPLPNIHTVETYRAMPARAANVQVLNTPTIVDHVPVIVFFLVYQCVHDKSDTFRWDNDGLVKAMNDVTNTSRGDMFVCRGGAQSTRE